MPSLSSSSNSVFGRFKRHPSEIAAFPGLVEEAAPLQSTAVPVPGSERSGELRVHKRDSSILSLSSSVQELRRSVSLRSHKSQPSGSSIGHRSRLSSAHVPTSDFFSPTDSADSPERPRTRNRLGSPLANGQTAAQSSDNLTGLANPPAGLIPLPSATPASPAPRSRIPNQMVTNIDVYKRHVPDRPSLSSQMSFARESNMNGPTMLPAPPTQFAGSQNPSALFQQIRETAAKRMATIEYLKRVHEGDVYYFSTLHYTPNAVGGLPSMNAHKLGRRSTSYLLLGYSLPALLDMNSGSPLEYLKALSSLLQEFETYQNLSGYDTTGSSLSRGRMGQILKSGMGLGKGAGKGRRASATTDSFMSDSQHSSLPAVSSLSSPQENASPVNFSGLDFHHLLTPNLPFDPDFGTTFATLCDTLTDTYLNLLGLVTGPELCTMSVGDAFIKADKAVRKILVANVMREFEDNTRAGVKSEVAGLQRLVLGGLM
ncbi:hypothetical protein LTR95_002200 [Oleoguttula sp. CCFEE 5521]